jgi:hypothetical protein
MFEEFIREIKRLDIMQGVQIPIKIPLDQKGYLDRRCPHRECSADFKVLFVDWRGKVPDNVACCPKCGKRTTPQDFNTPSQKQYIQQTAKAYAAKQVQGALRRAAGRTRPQKFGGGLLSFEMRVSYRAGALPVVLPIEAENILRQDFECEGCGCRYSTIGACYFCPACGRNSAIKDFEQTVATSLKAVDALNDIRNALASKYGPDAAADVSQQILEDQIENLITAFQRITEALFQRLPNAASYKCDQNLFQRLDDASALWQQATGRDYASLLQAAELAELGTMLQRRHKLGHSQGMVDQRYVDKSGDSTYAVGQRLVINTQQVHRLADIVRKLVDGLRQLIRASGETL